MADVCTIALSKAEHVTFGNTFVPRAFRRREC